MKLINLSIILIYYLDSIEINNFESIGNTYNEIIKITQNGFPEIYYEYFYHY